MVIESLISGHVYEVGDMVWAKMKSQPWLPGHVYSEEFATPLVRQSKREGLLLVAFFGASSFAWFDPSQLVPFDANYAEMCRQSDSRLFVKAVEDAVVEVNRRIGLGMSCMCRNKQNFRTTDVQGFVVVDAADCDSGAVYSVAALGKARDSFQPKLASDFLRRLALESDSSELVDDIDFIKNKAIVVSYRKAVFGNFDDSYDLASVQELATPQETSSKAPLSGMKVLANSLGKHTDSTKRKDHDKKDDYIFKRRDEPKEITKGKEKVASSLLPISFKDSASASGEFALKDENGCLEDRSPTVLEFSNPCFMRSTSVADSVTSFVAEVDQAKGKSADDKKRIMQEDDNYDKDLSRVLGDLHSLAVDPCNPVNRRSCSKGKKAFLRFRSLVFQKSKTFSLPTADGEPNATKSSEDNVEVPPVKSFSGLKRGPSERQKGKIVSKKKRVDDIRKLTSEKNILNNKIDEHPTRTLKKPESGGTALILKFQQGGYLPSFNELKARFARYGPMDHTATQIFRNTLSCQLVFRHRVHAEAAYRFVVGSASLFGNTDVKCSLKDVGEPKRLVKVPEDHHQPAMEDRPPSMVPPATSGVLVKSILKTSACEEVAGKGGNEVFADSLGKVTNTAKSTEHAKKDGYLFKSRDESKERKLDEEKVTLSSVPVGESGSGKSIMHEDSVQVPPVQPPSELKRGPPDIQKLMTAAKKKKAVDVKNLPKEKKVTKMIDEPGPTMLMIKFPRGGYLPSYNELKARLSCFGPMDHSGTHIYWNTSSCQVVFKHNADAQAAYRSVVGSSSLFGNKDVKCTLKAVGTSSARSEPLVGVPNEDHHQRKSILKISGGKEAAGNYDKGRVKFKLGREESQKSGATSIFSHLTTDQSTKNFEKVVHPSVVTSVTSSSTTPPPSPPPMHHDTTLLSPPVPTCAVQMTNGQLSDALMTQNVDITQQMLSLLIRCNDVVTNVSTILGYSPYQPL